MGKPLSKQRVEVTDVTDVTDVIKVASVTIEISCRSDN